jgi:chloride channel protein, CIC family
MDTSMRSWLDTVFLALLAIVVGVVVGYASLGFLWAIHWLHELLLGANGTNLYAQLEETSRFYLFFLPVIGAVMVSLIIKYGMPEQRNYGPADVIHAARLGKGYLSIRTGLVSASASIVSIGSGASVGRYGPVVHLGATLGAWLAQQLKLSQERRKTLLACGVAGAISASFSAPLAGVVFAHEVVLGRFGSRSVMPIVIASVVATTVAEMHATSGILFMLPELHVTHTWEYFLFALVGALGGGLAVIFMSMMDRSNQLAQRLPVSTVTRALLGGLLLGAIIVIFPQTFGLGEQVIRDALMLELTAGVMLALVFAKLLATSVSFAAGFAGGVFGPALYLGTMMGMVVGLGVHEFTDAASSPAVYGVAGMGAVISRVIGAPIATILIIFELTGSYSLTTAVMVSVVVGGTVTRDFFNQSYFYQQLRGRGIEPDESAARQSLQQIPLSTLMDKTPVVLTADMNLAVARSTLIKHAIEVAYVVNAQHQLLGQINVLQLLEMNDECLQAQSVSNFLSEPPVVFEANMNVLETFPKLKDFVGVNIPVVADGTSKQFVGIIYASKLADTYLQALEKARQDEH